MAQNISLLGADYPDVPAVQLPKTGGGTATYYDINVIDSLDSTSVTDALSANQGKVLRDKIEFNNLITNLNDSSLAGGTYIYGSDSTGAPTTLGGKMINMKSSLSGWGGQIACENSTEPSFWIRQKTSNGFGEWHRITDSYKELIYTNSSGGVNSGDITLTKAWSNFSYLIFETHTNGSDYYSFIVPCNASSIDGNRHSECEMNGSTILNSSIIFVPKSGDTTKTKLTLSHSGNNANWQQKIVKIWGQH